MPGRPRGSNRRFLPASGPQLWRLNLSGKLRLDDGASPISSFEAKPLIAAELKRAADPTGEHADAVYADVLERMPVDETRRAPAEVRRPR